MTKVLVIGGTGMLGHKLVQVLGRSFDVYSTIRGGLPSVHRFGIFDPRHTISGVHAEAPETVARAVLKSKPDVVINCVGIVKQRELSKDVVRMLEVNSMFPHILARLGREHGFRLVTISTDCVFAGTRGNYTENDTPDALDLYGQSKHWGEISDENCLTIRTSIIGRELASKQGLLEWAILNRGKCVDGYTKAVFSGFPTLVFADIIVDIIENHGSLSGVFHISSEPISKFALLKKINDRLDLGITINRFDEVILDRSLNSAQFRALTGFTPPAWDEMTEILAVDETPYDRWK